MFKPVTPKVDFPKMERETLKKWYEEGIIQKYLHKNDSAKQKFSFLDGPITANNPMGVHHAWGRTYKDLWQRFFNMQGFRQRFQNGFDCQGLWVEVEVEKELGFKNKKDIEKYGIDKFVQKCKERVLKFAKIQTEQSKRLGYFMDWDNSYFTMSDENNYAIWNFLKVVDSKGWLYKGRDTVPWCPRCGTAISQHEILTEDYQETKHKSAFVAYPIADTRKQNLYLLVWTTTPWTLPSNVAIAVDPEKRYFIEKDLDTEDQYIIINPGEREDASLPFKINNKKGFKKVGEVKGGNLVGLVYKGVFDDFPAVKKEMGSLPHRVISTDNQILPVNPNEGTGLIHIAPGAGAEDFQLAKKENLPIIESIDESAVFIKGFGELSGKNVREGVELIIKKLEEKQALFDVEDYDHRYPVCWRCKTELVWRVVDEWYIAMDSPWKSKIKNQKSKREEETFREAMIKVAKKINWIPKWGLERELDWLKNMHDWLISKKRYWGLAIPIWECQSCGKFVVIGSKEELGQKAVEGWEKFNGHSPHRPWVDQVKIKCEGCGQIASRIPDVGNPWLDAGIVPFSTLPEDWFPADFITESFPGQFKNWFYSLIAMSTVLKNTNPFKILLGHALVRDEKGEEVHKSKGNAIEFNEAADKIGVDVMRWLYLRTNPEHNVNFGYHVADQIRRQFHLMLWNIYNFFVTYANVDRWEAKSNKQKAISKNVLDRWILSRLNRTIKVVTDSLEKYDAYTASHTIEDFVNDLSLWYVRRSRDRVGPSAEDKIDKDACHKTLYEVLTTIARLLAPFTPFLTEEIYQNLSGKISVHLVDWPKADESFIDKELEKEMEEARQVVELAHAKRKEKGIKVRQPLPKLQIANCKLQIDEELLALIGEELNIKKVELTKGKGEISIEFETKLTDELKAEGEAREIVRSIQEERKKLGTRLGEKVDVVLKTWPKDFEEYIKRKALVRLFSKGKEFLVKRT